MFSKINSFFVFTGVLFISLLLVNKFYFDGNSSFLGITYAKKYQINTEKSATIINSYVIPGNTVSKGDLLIELESLELELVIKKLEKEVQNLESKKTEQQKLLESELELLYSKKRIIQNEVDNNVQQIESKIAVNKALSKDFIQIDNISDSLSQLHLQKKWILDKGRLEKEATNIQIKDLLQDHKFDQSQIQATIDLAKQELKWRLLEQQKLNKYALFDGVIEAVHVKSGEQVEAYTSLLTINPLHPTTVVGYLVGNKDRNRELNEIVKIRSIQQSTIALEGKIIGFGSITELPQILQKSTAVKAFGLEVFIEISGKNNLPVGEKVMIE